MKYLFLLAIIVLAFCSCEKENINGDWILKKEISESINLQNKVGSAYQDVFENDSIKISVELRNDTLVIKEKTKNRKLERFYIK